MFKRRGSELAAPPISRESTSQEVMRVWTANGQPQQVTLRATWSDPAAWGIMLVDIARHASRAYAAGDVAREREVLLRIRQAFDAEWQDPTNEAQQVKWQRHCRMLVSDRQLQNSAPRLMLSAGPRQHQTAGRQLSGQCLPARRSQAKP